MKLSALSKLKKSIITRFFRGPDFRKFDVQLVQSQRRVNIFYINFNAILDDFFLVEKNVLQIVEIKYDKTYKLHFV